MKTCRRCQGKFYPLEDEYNYCENCHDLYIYEQRQLQEEWKQETKQKEEDVALEDFLDEYCVWYESLNACFLQDDLNNLLKRKEELKDIDQDYLWDDEKLSLYACEIVAEKDWSDGIWRVYFDKFKEIYKLYPESQKWGELIESDLDPFYEEKQKKVIKFKQK